MGLFDQRVMPGPMLLDCVEFRLEIDHCLGYHIKPDKFEMQRRQLVGVMRKLILPLIYSRVRFLNARTNSKKRTA